VATGHRAPRTEYGATAVCPLHLERIDQLTAAIAELSAQIEEQMRPFAHQLEHLATIPGHGPGRRS